MPAIRKDMGLIIYLFLITIPQVRASIHCIHCDGIHARQVYLAEDEGVRTPQGP